MAASDDGPVSAEFIKDLVLINELVASEGQLGPTLRAVYDSEDGGAVQSTFLEGLDSYTKRMDTEIERMCNKYYQGFIDSIEELLQVRPGASKLKELVVEAGQGLDQSGEALLQGTDDVVQWRTTQRNILLAIEALTNCLPVLKLFCKINTQLAAKRYYPALKALLELENVHLPRVSKYTFAQRIRERVPLLRKRVKAAAHDELQDFLASIRDRSGKVGEAAMKQVLSSQNAKISDFSEKEMPVDLCASDLADFSALYRTLHIYQVLGCRHECEQYYREERKKQVQLVLQPVAKLDTLPAYSDYFFQIAGFFLVEDTVLSTTEGLIERQWADEVWESAVARIAGVLEIHLSNCKTSETICSVKELIALFNQTLQGYGYNVGRLFEILLQVRERYTAVLLEQSHETFGELMLADNFAPVMVHTEEEYRAIADLFPFGDRVFQEAPLPKTFPFSGIVPAIYRQLRDFIDTSVKFVSDLDLSHTEVDELVRKATNQMLSRVVTVAIFNYIERCSNPLHLAQISVNATHLEAACAELERYVSSITHSRDDEVHVTRLHGATAFKDVRQACEDKIYAILQAKIDEFFDLGEYDWTPPEDPGKASDFVYDMLAYLTTISASLATILRDVAKSVYIETCKYINRKFLALVQDDTVKRMNMNGFRTFGMDVEMCEQYADNCPLAAPGDALCQDIFAPLRQLADLVLKWDWASFLDDAVRVRKYPAVRIDVALGAIVKYDDTEKKSFLFKSSDEKRRGREKEQIIKRLRALADGP
eukprot:m.54286 g.54286  ORF g.54286 m.54286 type:complete len:766 (+) comp11885_c0_seq3:1210-3507(+)